jgi:hypothetical protein
MQTSGFFLPISNKVIQKKKIQGIQNEKVILVNVDTPRNLVNK